MTDYVGKATVAPHSVNPNWCVLVSEHDDIGAWEFRYNVPLDGAEELHYRKAGTEDIWEVFPAFANPPVEVMEFFHGPLISDGEINEPSDDSKALNYMAEVMTHNEWDADMTGRLADIIRSTGRSVHDPDE